MYLFDTYAIIELLLSNPNYEKYKNFPIVTTLLNAGECQEPPVIDWWNVEGNRITSGS